MEQSEQMETKNEQRTSVQEVSPELREQIAAELREKIVEELREQIRREFEEEQRLKLLRDVRERVVEEYELNSDQIEVLDALKITDPKDLLAKVERIFGPLRKPKVRAPVVQNGQEVFTLAQIKDPKFWRENRERIMKAVAEGRIVE